MNRVGGNHLYFNVLNSWVGSLKEGALMIRPLIGKPVTNTAVADSKGYNPGWAIYPNPATTTLHIISADAIALKYAISDMQGRMVSEGLTDQKNIPIESLAPGMYLLRLNQRGAWSLPQKFIKQ
jgi:hypothetical protein